jgi:hypothetical protein
MVRQLPKIARILLTVGVLQVACLRNGLAQQSSSPSRVYSSAPTYAQAPRELPRLSRNVGDVFSGALKNAGVSTAGAEQPIKSGVYDAGREQFNADGEVYEGEIYDEGCDQCVDFCSPNGYGTFYGRAEYLAWWLSGDSYPTLVTSSPNGTPQSDAGVLGQSGTRTLFGDNSFNDGSRNGVRTVLGISLTPSTRIEGDWFTLGSKGAEFHQSSEGNPILARPFFNLSTGAQDSNLIAYPGLLDGRIDIRADTQFMGAGINVIRNLSYYAAEQCCGYKRVDFIYGFRYLGLYEHFNADTSSTVTGQSTAPIGTVINVSDAFVTSNNFFGGNIGIASERNRGRWFLSSAAKLGIGGTNQHVNIAGSTSITQPGDNSTTSNGGLLALPTNIGRYSHNSFGLVPHLEFRLAYMLTPRMRWTLGYDVMYWSRVVRPGDQIDLFVNPTQASGQNLQGTPGPLFPFKETDLWIQGISTGLELQF